MTSQSISITVSRALVPTAIRLWEAWDDRKQLNAQTTVSRPAPLPPRLVKAFLSPFFFWKI
jgi:hypothetical protein